METSVATPEQIRAGIKQLRKYLGTRYVIWNGVWPPNQGIFYNAVGEPPAPEVVKERGILCSGAVSLYERCVDGQTRETLETWGTLSIERDLKNRRAFKPGTKYPVGTVLGYPFARDNDGHVVIVSTEPDENGDQMTIGADRQFGLNERRTVRQAHELFNFTYAGELDHIGVIPLGGGGGSEPDKDAPFIDRPLFGLDLHPQFQFGFDFARARELGYEFVWIKGAEGPYRDGTVLPLPNFKPFVKEAQAEGFVVGIYDYLLSTPPRKQAEHYLKRLELVGGPDGFMIGPDFEGYGEPGSEFYYLTPGNEHLREFNGILDEELGNPPITIYSGPGFWKGGIPSGAFGQYGADVAWSAIWPNDSVDHNRVRDYYQSIKDEGWGKDWGGVVPRFWQFTSRGLVGGEYVDVDAFRGDKRMLQKLVVGGREEPPPPPPPPPPGEDKPRMWTEPEIRSIARSETNREDQDMPPNDPGIEENRDERREKRRQRRKLEKAEKPKKRRISEPVATGAKRGSAEGLILAFLGALILGLPGVELPPGFEGFGPIIILALTAIVRTLEARTLDA